MAKAKPRAPGRAREAESETVAPKIGVTKVRPVPPPQIEESPMFFFTHHPERWLVMGGRVIPGLGKLKLSAGLNGVDQHPKSGELLISHVLETARENGLTVIPHDVDGPGTSYLRKPIGTNAILSKWERVYAGSNQIDCDEAGYVEWTRSLVEREVVGQPPPYVLDRLRASLVKQIEDLSDKPASESLRKRLVNDLRAVEQELGESAPLAAAETVSLGATS